MIGVVDQGKGIHKNFRTRAVGLLEETRTNMESGNKAVIRVVFCLEYHMKHCVDGVARLMLKCFLLYQCGRL